MAAELVPQIVYGAVLLFTLGAIAALWNRMGHILRDIGRLDSEVGANRTSLSEKTDVLQTSLNEKTDACLQTSLNEKTDVLQHRSTKKPMPFKPLSTRKPMSCEHRSTKKPMPFKPLSAKNRCPANLSQRENRCPSNLSQRENRCPSDQLSARKPMPCKPL